MPEGDAVWRTARRLHAALAGGLLTRTDLRWPGISTADLTGRLTLEVVPRGKHLLQRIEGGWTLHSHLRMDGSWRIEPTHEPPKPLAHHEIRAVVATATSTAVGAKLGLLDLVRTPDEHTVVGHLGPDLLDPAWSADHLATAIGNLAASDDTIGGALLDQRNLAGCGTIWTSEPLFALRLDPWTPARTLTESQLEALVTRARALLLAAIGSRAPQQVVYGRGRRPCVRCGTPLRTGRVGPPTRERTLTFCPRCQSGQGSSKRTPGVPDATSHALMPSRALTENSVAESGENSTP